jgi:hypothetical protein
MLRHPLDFNTRKALCVHLGETAGREIANLIFGLAARVEALERGKVDVTPIVPEPPHRGTAVAAGYEPTRFEG